MKRSEGRDTTPHPKRPCFAVCAAVCDFSLKAECVHPFVRESERGPFVREVEKRDEKRFGDKIYGSSFARFFSFADVEGLQRTGKCMYIKAWRSKRNFAGSTGHTVVERGKAPVSPCVSLCAILLTKASVYTFIRKSERGPFVREAEKCDEMRFGTALCR